MDTSQHDPGAATGSVPVLSRVGIGGWQAGGRGPWGGGPRSDDDLSIAAIRHAIEGGVTWVETAASYGLGHSEEVIARALEPWRVGEDVLVFSKCGHPWEAPDRIWTELSPESIRRECEGSLRRLRVERIDLYLFHHADPNTPVEESWATLADLVAAGKVRWAGVSNFTVDLLERCQAIRAVDFVQPELNLLRPAAAEDVIPWCRDHHARVITYSPQASGLLAAPASEARLAAPDPEGLRGLHPEAIARLNLDLAGIAARIGTTMSALAVAWVLQVPGVTGAICGARTPAQVDAWLPAGTLTLSEEVLREIRTAMDRAGIRRPSGQPE
jgi:aryl-alcohol dehydrogenase-like predicted oxidoreductase